MTGEGKGEVQMFRGGNRVHYHRFQALKRLEEQRRRQERKDRLMNFLAGAACFVVASAFVIVLFGVCTWIGCVALFLFFDKVVNRKKRS